jgi:hypothetical protein
MNMLVDEKTNVRVSNDGKVVFEGVLKDFVYINEFDEETIEFVNGLLNKDSHEQQFFHSGDWKIEKI